MKKTFELGSTFGVHCSNENGRYSRLNAMSITLLNPAEMLLFWPKKEVTQQLTIDKFIRPETPVMVSVYS